MVIARRVVEIFSPQRPPLKLDNHAYSAAILNKIITAAGHLKSYQTAAHILKVVGEISISGRHVNRLTQEIGTELKERRDQETEDYLHHRRAEVTAEAPPIAVVALDGGRVQTRSPKNGPGVHEQGWKEDKVGCLLNLEGESFEEDPHPQPPRCFLDAPQVDELVRQIQSQTGRRQENELPLLEALGLAKPTSSPSEEVAGGEAVQEQEGGKPDWPPVRCEAAPRSCVATMRECGSFGKMVAAQAWQRNFQGADRQALLGDGSAWIWNLHKKWFSEMTPVTDFVHVLTYLYVTASVLSEDVNQRWQRYVQWMSQCWRGEVRSVLEELRGHQRVVGLPPPEGEELAATDPRVVLKTTLGYLENNQERMKYDEYRRSGLPVTSSMVESLIKEINYRVKGTEKFWNDPEGAEAILQIRAGLLSDDSRVNDHIKSRPGRATRRRVAT